MFELVNRFFGMVQRRPCKNIRSVASKVHSRASFLTAGADPVEREYEENEPSLLFVFFHGSEGNLDTEVS